MLGSKTFHRHDELPSLKMGSPSFRKDIYQSGSALNSPSRFDSQLDETTTKSFTGKKKKLMGMTFSNLQSRSASLANHEDFKNKGILLSQPSTKANLEMATVRKKEAVKKIAMWEKITALKTSLGRYLDPNEVPRLPSRLDIRRIIKCLETLNDEDSNLTELMQIVVNVLKAALFVDWKVIEPFEERLSEECNDEMRNVLQNCKKEGAPYHYLCMALIRELTADERTNLKEEKHKREITELRRIIGKNEKMIAYLDQQLNERIPPDEHMKLMEEMTTYRTTYDEIARENIEIKNHCTEIQEENTGLRRQIEIEVIENDKHISQIRQLEKAKENVLIETEESRKQIALMKEKIRGFKDTMDKMIVKLGNVKAQVLDLRRENEELLYQNEKLSLRAARGFDALTPRPDYRKLLDEKKMDLEIYDKLGRRQMMPTIKVIDELLNKIQGLEAERSRENAALKKGKTANLKLLAANAFKTPSNSPKRPSILAQQTPPQQIQLPPPSLTPSNSQTNKPRGSLMDPSPSGQKSLFSKENSFKGILGSISPRNAATLVFENQSRVSSKNLGTQEESASNKGDDSQITEVNEIGTPKRARLGGYLSKANSIERKSDKEEPVNMFGEETIKQADQLIDFAVKTKKAIDKFD